jgi:hypothetical protein
VGGVLKNYMLAAIASSFGSMHCKAMSL